MKRKSFPIVLALIVILFSSWNCMAASALFPSTPTPTSTSTQTPTVTPSPSPTLTPTITVTPTPDISSAELQLSDLPSGFSPLSIPINSTNPNMKWFEYGSTSPLQMIMGGVVPMRSNEEFGFDAMMKNPDLLLQAINGTSSSNQVKNLKPISGLGNFGDASAGLNGLMTSQGVTLQTDLFIMRKGSIGIFVISFYPQGQEPVMSIVDLAKILNQRASQFPIDAFSG